MAGQVISQSVSVPNSAAPGSGYLPTMPSPTGGGFLTLISLNVINTDTAPHRLLLVGQFAANGIYAVQLTEDGVPIDGPYSFNGVAVTGIFPVSHALTVTPGTHTFELQGDASGGVPVVSVSSRSLTASDLGRGSV